MVEFSIRRKGKGREEEDLFMEEDGVYGERELSLWRLWSTITPKEVESQKKRYGYLYLYRGILKVEFKIKIGKTWKCQGSKISKWFKNEHTRGVIVIVP